MEALHQNLMGCSCVNDYCFLPGIINCDNMKLSYAAVINDWIVVFLLLLYTLLPLYMWQAQGERIRAILKEFPETADAIVIQPAEHC